MFKGSIVALVTPFLDGKIDEAKLAELVEFHVEHGTSAIVSCGTTGESATMSHEEDIFVTEFVVKRANKRIPVIAGTGSNSTREAILLTDAAKRNGADAALVVTPYYNKPTQEGMYQHYKTIAENIDIPIIIYNVPGRTGVAIYPETVARLSTIPGIVAIKEASGTVDAASQILKELPAFNVLSGDDGLTLPMMSLGAQGVISVAANIVPQKIADMCNMALNGDYAGARKVHFECFDLFKALFYETNPIPVKAAMNLMGIMSDELRLPLCRIGQDAKAKLAKTLKELGLIQ